MDTSTEGQHTSAMDGKVRKIAVLGARGVGKTSISSRFCEGTFDDSYLPTIEDSYQASIRINNTLFICEVLDTAGQDEYSILGTQLTIGVHGFILVYSVRDRTSLEMIKYINDKLLVTLGVNSVPRILVGNQSDSSASEREVSYQEGEAYARELQCPFVECSAKSGDHVKDVFVTLIRNMEPAGTFGNPNDKKISSNPSQKQNQNEGCIIN
mmetsp:Transcript_552/g.980  ORF Transcript_552/g.980 Transcript_552/m.980 type:complete len:211 (-) Transcript_552:74-706(-)